MPPTDYELIKQTLDGDNGAFGVLWRRYHAPILGMCRKYLAAANIDPSVDAADIVGETFVRALHYLHTYHDRSSEGIEFESWLYEVARRACLKHLTSGRHRKVPLTDESRTIPTVHDEPLAIALEQDSLRIAMQLVNALPPIYRMPLQLSLEERSHNQIAAALGISPETAAKRI